MRRASRIWIHLVISAILCLIALGMSIDFKLFSASVPASAASVQPEIAIPLATPDTVISEPLLEWAIGDPMLYWANRCVPGPDAAAAETGDVPSRDDPKSAASHLPLRRVPLNGGAIRTLDTSHDSDCLNYRYMTADASAVYYFNDNDNSIQSIAIDQAGTPPVTLASNLPTVSAELMLNGDFIYFGTTSRTIQRIPISGGAAELIVNTSAAPRDLDALGSTLYWIDSNGVWTAPFTCNGCAPSQYSDEGGNYLLVNSQRNLSQRSIFWVIDGGFNQPDRILTQIPVVNGVRDITVYSGPVNYRIGDLTALYTGFLNQLTYLYWTESAGGVQNFVRRQDPDESTAEVIAQVDGILDHRTRINSRDVYFARIDPTSPSILKIPFDADALTRDMRAVNWEVTQAIQNLENGVPLVADKPTFVRLYGDQADGTLSGSAEAWLEGSRNGTPLPGSPLSPINGQQALETGAAFDRSGATEGLDGWLFKLPASWDNVGDLDLQAVVDPRNSFTDGNRTNNELSGSFTFTAEADPCLFFWPVKTHQPLPHYTDPSFQATLDRLESMWPVDNVDMIWVGEPIRELEACLDWDLHCWGPWELDQGWEIDNFPPDSDRLLFKLMLRHTLSTIDSLFYCDADSSVHTVGMVHPDSDTGGTGGYANFLIGASWVKFEDINTNSSRPWNEPTSGATLAQELTHNFWRYHIGCFPEEDSFFGVGDWPYTDRCQLDDRPQSEVTTHFGFDPLSHDIVRPDEAGDYMTYRGNRWVSDYTFKDVKDIFGGIFGQASTRAERQDTGAEMILATGMYESEDKVGRLYYTYILPDTMLNDGVTGTEPEAPNLSRHDGETPPTASLRLRGPDNALLAEHPLTLLAPDSHTLGYTSYIFIEQVPKPDGDVALLELVVDGAVVDTRTPSANAPTVEILAPAADAVLNEDITLRWQGSDPDGDELLYSVNYSPDNKQTWIPLATEYPGDLPNDVTAYPLSSAETLPGSGGQNAYLRIIASDGFNTSFAEVGPFTVTDRPPQAAIQSPPANSWFEPTAPIILRGRGYDAETGDMDGDTLSWQVDGGSIGSGNQQTVNGLAPGRHTASLTATDATNKEATTTRTFDILPLSIEEASATPRLDGYCGDSGYEATTQLSLAPFSAGGQATVSLARRSGDLWLCVTGLPQATGEEIAQMSLWLDANHSQDASIQSDDRVFGMGEDGTPFVQQGDGSGGLTATTSSAFSARSAATGETWSAEIRLDGDALGLWQSAFGLGMGYAPNGEATENASWPYAGEKSQPSTWAEVSPQVVPVLESIDPISATVGISQVTLLVNAQQLGESATVIANDAPQTTVLSSTGQLTATLSGSLLQSAGEIEIRVATSTTGEVQSAPLTFTLYNPTPELVSTDPVTIESGTQGATITLSGEHFVNGAVAYWNGEPRPTRFINSQTVEMDLTQEDLVYARRIGVSVLNPTPSLGGSNVLPFQIQPSSAAPIFLPLIQGE